MDVSHVFRSGFGPVIPRPPPPSFPQRQPLPHHRGDDESDNGSSHRIAHTLTACCRCRQRKTRCDPTLPRCLPCERSSSTCEYYDTTKGKKIPRYYVVRLQEKVRQLEEQLSQFTEEDEFPRSSEDIVRQGGLVRLHELDETPRYLGPSSGIAMTRILMEEAKRYTDSKRISEVLPNFRAQRNARPDRMQSIIMGSISGPASRRASYPKFSAHPATGLPKKEITAKLVEVFNTRAQVFYPTLHEKLFANDLQAVVDGDNDPHKNFIVRMVMAISLQKLDTQYSGLADSYWLAAMERFEEVIGTKDLKTLQCLVLIGQYSLLTPVRTSIYHVIGIATRICQQLGYGDEKTLTSDAHLVDPLTLDLRRRLSWMVALMEFGLAHSMGRPNGFAKGEDLMDVGFFADVPDENITEQGIQPGPPSENKLVAIHLCKMRVLQAEIRRTLYEKKRSEPRDDGHPWFAAMEQKLKKWLDAAPEQPAWCKPWFTGRYHAMMVFMFRPSPQVPKPSPSASLRCYESCAYIINLGSQQVKKAAIDITWVFLLTIYMSLNTVLWSISYTEVRDAHSKDEVQNLVNAALEIIGQCQDRWPGAEKASPLYEQFAKACMQSYEMRGEAPQPNGSPYATSPSFMDSHSPPLTENSMPTPMSTHSQPSQPPMFSTPQFSQFGYVFSTPEPVNPMFSNFDSPFQQNNHPQFRSGSIFLHPSSSSESVPRRPSNFAPDDAPTDDHITEEQPTPPASTTPHAGHASPPLPNTLPTPPESLNPGSAGFGPLSPSSTVFTGRSSPTPKMAHASPVHLQGNRQAIPSLKYEPSHSPEAQGTPQQNTIQPLLQQQQSQRTPTFTIPPIPQQQQPIGTQQRPLPTTVTDWFNPPPPFISPYAFNGMNNNTNSYFPDPSSTFSSLGLSGARMDGLPNFAGPQFAFPPERQGSLSQEQQMELMDVLETDGMNDIDTFLNMNISFGGVDGGVGWQ